MANLMSKAHKATNEAYREGYDRVFRKECTVWLEDVTKPGDSVRKYRQLGCSFIEKNVQSVVQK